MSSLVKDHPSAGRSKKRLAMVRCIVAAAPMEPAARGRCGSTVVVIVLILLGLWFLVAGCALFPSTFPQSTALPTEVPVSPTPSLAPSATLRPTALVPVPPPIATETTWLATPAERLSGQIAVSLYSLALIDLQGSPSKFLGPHPPTYSQFSWAPDGSKLAYLLLADLWVVDVETHQTWNLTYRGWYGEPDRWELMPSWSPDGRWVAYVDNDDRSLWVIKPFDPAEKYQIMGAFCCEGPVAWRPESPGR